MKLHTITAALAMAGLGFAGATAHAQGISDDVIRIGFITDMSGVYSDIDGKAGLEAVRMAVEDFGGTVNGKKIEIVSADHQNKADVASARAREWFDQQKVDVIIAGTNSATSLAMAAVAAEKKKPFIAVGAGSSDLTNAQCSPYTVHYAYDTVALARGTGSAVVKDGGKSWFFLTADYAFGHALERDTMAVVKAAGGEVKGQVRAPLGASDFSSFLLQAQASKAQILGMANAGGDTINTVKAANEFGVTKTMKLAGLLVFINDVHSLGLDATKGMYLTDGWYWDQSDASRAWSKKFESKVGRKPSMLQAGDYSSAMFYLNAVKATGSDNGDDVMKWMKSNKVNDFFAQGGVVREDGRMVHDMYLMQVKTPAESKGPWDYYKVVATLPGDEVYTKLSESTCKLVKK
ncbi:ABC transporter substrate-binding protein [Achromobacter mucicolens]|jgi:branched-chain amino acid transport system substrate-binding protein|uniref:Leucine-binding protein domain-containing protein n=1 Tax=Achromobacter mucicolens TaxID=1389922 RepID=A0ABM8LER6_9BURK|nr:MULTISPECIES: ABC transporter substrate-binding protein [Achromobacter]KRB13017.1 ABC transporter permease [Achromobacter sp. Root170]MCP2515860.1 ABC transporter substrate-binding protein [Achromobacter mucicolens]MCU6615065.1 ABC transporter substrate-binding protein [Achromobacter mucicolens]MDF2859914.1 Leucine, isoleucine, valine-, threonine-, and alanine-binding protein [Achromobacter mucicolens]TQJ94204.1 amino acid/amide ABC transporter substrate-binding protein (HAAT family) [Achro